MHQPGLTGSHTSMDERFHTLKKVSVRLRTEPVSNRKDRLRKIRDWIHANRPLIHEAMFADFQKPSAEVDGIEIFHVLNEIRVCLAKLDQWTRPRKVDAPLSMLGTRSSIYYEAKGVCLIISPWNYPFCLAIGPLVSAIAAGNAVVIKPSELTPHVSSVIARLVKEVFDDQTVGVCEGGRDVSQYLLTLPFDHIFFTGSPIVGKAVMKAAAENLISVTLELGGKSPVIITSGSNLKDAARRIAVAKFVNNGQTCLAPDYILIDKKISSTFLAIFLKEVRTLFSDNGNFDTSTSYCRIVNHHHFDRLCELLQDALAQGAKPELSGEVNRDTKFFHPVILTHVSPEGRLMEEEIFGPILPVLEFASLDQALEIIKSKPKPLALYIFSRNKKEQTDILQQTSSGGVCINDCAIHFLHHDLPFGGINHSGMGKSHGHYGFLAFSNEKPVLKQKNGFTTISLFYPPYTKTTKKLMEWFLKLF